MAGNMKLQALGSWLRSINNQPTNGDQVGDAGNYSKPSAKRNGQGGSDTHRGQSFQRCKPLVPGSCGFLKRFVPLD